MSHCHYKTLLQKALQMKIVVDIELELLRAFGYCRCTWLSMCSYCQLLTIHKLIIFSIDDYLHTKLLQKLFVKCCLLLMVCFLLSAQCCASFTSLYQGHMPSKPPERRAIGYMISERRLEVGWRRETSRNTLSDRFLATIVGLSTLGTFFTHAPPTAFQHF